MPRCPDLDMGVRGKSRARPKAGPWPRGRVVRPAGFRPDSSERPARPC